MTTATSITQLPAQIRTATPTDMSRDFEFESPSSLGDETTPDSELSLSSESSPEPHHVKTSPFETTINSKARAKAKAKTLSFEEQISLLRAVDNWRTTAIPSKSVASIKTSDGPNGARGGIFKAGTRAALFPCGISLAATWDKALLYEVGEHLADEVKARSAHVLLAPTVCLHRGPLGGRNFESFSEDPYLTGKLAASYINGLQSKGVGATIKHFVANEQEFDRLNMDSVVDERTLRELYLRPFEIAVREANPWAFMSSYNLINGVHADMNRHTLIDILRGDWKYDGMIMSDWTGTNSTGESIEAGLDLQMPYEDKWRNVNLIREALKENKLSLEAIEAAAANVLHLVDRVRGNDMSAETAEREEDTQEHRELIRRAGQQGLTLLKNQFGLLPIREHQTKIAVIGPNANRAVAGGGGSASLNPYYNTIPLESIRKVAGKEVSYAMGCDSSKWLPLATPFCKAEDGEQGATVEFFKGWEFEGEPAVVQRRTTTDLMLWDSAPENQIGGSNPKVWCANIKTTLTPKTSGRHTLSFLSVGPGHLFIDGDLVVDLWNWAEQDETMFDSSTPVNVELDLEAGKPVELLAKITTELRPIAKQALMKRTYGPGGIRIGFQEEDKVDRLQEAVKVAKAADVAVVIVGLDADWESEGYDRKTMDLPKDGSQDRLVEAILAANPNTIVVVQGGSPVTMPWADRAPTILQAWYQGQEAGNALTDVLFGAANPSGKLPTTFPRRLEDSPSYHNWVGENRKVRYGEGIFIGYRYYESAKIKPLFPFGHGLSYTSFEYGRLSKSTKTLTKQGKIDITLAVTNTGSVAGAEVVQAYVHDQKSRLARPQKELAAFEKVFLLPGETKHVVLTLDKHSVGYYDTTLDLESSSWIAEEGLFDVLVGSSSLDIRQSTTFEVKDSFAWIF